MIASSPAEPRPVWLRSLPSNSLRDVCVYAREEQNMGEQQEREQLPRKVPAYVLVGFLGSGKTTVLGNLIEWCVEHDLKPGLIINEFGDISIDGEALRQEGMPMTELSS